MVVLFAKERKLETFLTRLLKKVFMKIPLCTLWIILITTTFLHGTVLVPGSSVNPTQTLPVPIAQFLGRADGFAVLSAAQAGAQEFSLASYNMITETFFGIALQNITLNGEQTTSPLYDKPIDFIALISEGFELNLVNSNTTRSLVVIPDKNAPIAYRLMTRSVSVILATTPLPDARGNPAGTVIALTGSTVARAYAVVAPAAGTFGDVGSGIAIVGTNVNEIGFITAPQATQLDGTIPAVRIGTNQCTIQAPVSMNWSFDVRNLYIGLGSVTGGPAPTDGICTVVRGVNRPDLDNPLVLTSMLVPSFDTTELGTDTIIVAKAPNVTGATWHVETMRTSTRQELLVVCGGILTTDQTPEAVHNTVYALPLVVTDTNLGYLAKRTDTTMPAQNSADLLTINDAAAQIGGGSLPAGAISQLSIRNDTVFATCSDGEYPGVYASTALFDSSGMVQQWTVWQRAIATPNKLYDASFDVQQGNWLLVTGENTPTTVLRTVWNTAPDSTGFAQAIAQLSGQQPQSITNISMINFATPGAGNTALALVVERNQLFISQTGIRLGTTSLYEPLPATAYGATVIAENSTLTEPITNQPTVLLRGGPLDTIGPLTCTTIAHSAARADTWLWVAGQNGLCVWATADGNGWGPALGNNLSELPVGLTLHTIGNYSDVRALYADGSSLFVLMPQQLDRLELNTGALTPTITTIVTVPDSLPSIPTNGIINDFLVSDGLALVATTNGLYRTADSTRVTDKTVFWQQQLVPESEEPVVHVNGIGADGSYHSLARTGGNCWILSGTARNNRSVLNRFATNILTGAVQPGTVQPFSCDRYVIGVDSFVVDGGDYKDLITTNGAITFFARSPQGNQPASVRAPQAGYPLESNQRFVGLRSIPVALPSLSQTDIIAIMQEPASGSWVTATAHGLIINE
jgi:hypothetical protein